MLALTDKQLLGIKLIKSNLPKSLLRYGFSGMVVDLLGFITSKQIAKADSRNKILFKFS